MQIQLPPFESKSNIYIVSIPSGSSTGSASLPTEIATDFVADDWDVYVGAYSQAFNASAQGNSGSHPSVNGQMTNGKCNATSAKVEISNGVITVSGLSTNGESNNDGDHAYYNGTGNIPDSCVVVLRRRA